MANLRISDASAAAALTGAEIVPALQDGQPVKIATSQMMRSSNAIIVAASDSSASAKARADVICTGTNDHVAINSAIDSLTSGGTVLFRAGTYNLASAIVIDRDWVTLKGEGKSHWSKYNGPYPTHAVAGAPGGAKLLQATSAQKGIVIGTTTANMHGDTRHKGIAIRDLYICGANYNGTGIYSTDFTDIAEIRNCMIQGFATGIDVNWDTPQIIYNSVQDNSLHGILTNGVFGLIHGNISFDNGGNGIWCNSYGTTISSNTVGDVSADGIAVTKALCMVVGNHVEGCPNGCGIVVAEFTEDPYGVAIVGNTVELTGIRTPNTTNNTTKWGISIGVGLHAIKDCAVSGNIIGNASTVNSTGFAMGARPATSINNAFSGNVIRGNKWNAGASNTAQGTGNTFSGNAGMT